MLWGHGSLRMFCLNPAIFTEGTLTSVRSVMIHYLSRVSCQNLSRNIRWQFPFTDNLMCGWLLTGNVDPVRTTELTLKTRPQCVTAQALCWPEAGTQALWWWELWTHWLKCGPCLKHFIYSAYSPMRPGRFCESLSVRDTVNILPVLQGHPMSTLVLWRLRFHLWKWVRETWLNKTGKRLLFWTRLLY
jgi:hypothetical protein